jgi:tRNA threonylcarbamoyladenosine biosynthesis protein TsaE
VTTANRFVVHTRSAARTRALGRRLAKLLRAGDVVFLQGPLGAGKTTLAQGIGAGLGIDGPVRSPTFVLLAEHGPAPPTGSGLTLYHADLYRLDDPTAVDDLALEEQARSGVLLVEWPERGLDVLPSQHLLVVLEPDAEDAVARRITFVAVGDRYVRIIDGLQAAGAADRKPRRVQ